MDKFLAVLMLFIVSGAAYGGVCEDIKVEAIFNHNGKYYYVDAECSGGGVQNIYTFNIEGYNDSGEMTLFEVKQFLMKSGSESYRDDALWHLYQPGNYIYRSHGKTTMIPNFFIPIQQRMFFDNIDTVDGEISVYGDNGYYTFHKGSDNIGSVIRGYDTGLGNYHVGLVFNPLTEDDWTFDFYARIFLYFSHAPLN